ncbi:L-histidine N(alpha)-methyltransferase [Leeuwenhoekiella marinoflava]|uniref:Dimethylhistidine N-methyltransferase n=2 Tax=Leeuwenhoekiella marinoflava TaxID=988 RepID=A0A4Q0PNJ7_9FLAO|nr:L-histidine N(alpha)-methyltransferase [Leeuwenhoekiella marinoflava]RXG32100.1 dimethylhistidine N-methyltransferase [Leeuwenhoekiella marinoflava]SHE97922.1 dimethylhistidine N-methyltransferase [Leeuwenhoekiella marinoflava DSM 3653]
MKTEQQTQFKTAFEQEVYEGLTTFPKKVSSKWFYDKKGDKLFQQIMELPEYYLTGCEYEIIDTHKQEITKLFQEQAGFDLIELGAGDGKKTKILLEKFASEGINFTYKPIDISQNMLDELKNAINHKWPQIDIKPEQGSYFDVLKDLGNRDTDRKMVIMVLGSNIGNLTHPQAVDFLVNIRKTMRSGDLLFMGLDQKKNPELVLSAYNDSQGITEAFNKNLLHRINEELESDFDTNQFKHWPVYDPETGTAKSFLVSTQDQKVTIKKLNLEINFTAWESIHTEISQKYDDNIVEWLSKEAGLEILAQYSDKHNRFTDYVFKVR